MPEPSIELQDFGCSHELSSRLKRAEERCQAILKNATLIQTSQAELSAPAVAVPNPCQSGHGPEATEQRDSITTPSDSASLQSPLIFEDGRDVHYANAPAQNSSNNARSNTRNGRSVHHANAPAQNSAKNARSNTRNGRGIHHANAPARNSANNARRNTGNGRGVPRTNAPAQSSSNNARSNTGNGRGIHHANAPARNSFNAANTGGVREPGLNGLAIPDVSENQDRCRTLLSAYALLAAGVGCILIGVIVFVGFGIAEYLAYSPDKPRWIASLITMVYALAAMLLILLGIELSLRAFREARSDTAERDAFRMP